MNKVNVSYLEEICGGSKETIIEMIDIFRNQIPEFYNEMSELLERKRYFDLGLLAHKAKSSVAIMGMENLALILKELELKSKDGEDIDKYPEFIKSFKSETDIALLELDEYIKNI